METNWTPVRNTLDQVPGLMPPSDLTLPYWSATIATDAEVDRLFFDILARYDTKQFSMVYNHDGITPQLDLNTRYTHYYDPNSIPNGKEFESRMNAEMARCVQSWFGKSVRPAVSSPQILGYEEKCLFQSHCDNSIFVEGAWKRNDPLRDMTGLLFMSEHKDYPVAPNQFSGGELILDNLVDRTSCLITVKPKKGLFIAFPSHPIFMHRVPAITRGYRIAFVNWWTVV